jgi:hypothetical protein
VHAVLAERGIRVQERLWTATGRAWLADLDLPAVQRGVEDDCSLAAHWVATSTSSGGIGFPSTSAALI